MKKSNLLKGLFFCVVALAIHLARYESIDDFGVNAMIEHLETGVYVGEQVTLLDYTSVALKSGINKLDLNLSVTKNGYNYPVEFTIYTYGNNITGGGWSMNAAQAVSLNNK